MADDDTVIVGSRVHTAIQIAEPMQDTDKPGLVPAGPVFVLNGANHPDAINGVGVTHGVHAGLFRRWLDHMEKTNDPRAGQVFEMSPDEAKRPEPPVMPSVVNPEHFGFEPALQRMTDSASQAGDGSTVTHAGPVTSEEMAAHSDTPQDDRPTSQTDIVPAAHEQEPATNVTAPENSH